MNRYSARTALLFLLFFAILGTACPDWRVNAAQPGKDAEPQTAGNQTVGTTAGNNTNGNQTMPLAAGNQTGNNGTQGDQPTGLPAADRTDGNQTVTTPAPISGQSFTDKTGQGAFTTITSCAPLSEQLGKSRQDVAASLVELGRKKALDVFLHRFYAPGKKAVLPQMTPGFVDQVQSLLAPVDQPRLFNGKEFGQLCAQSVFSLPQHAFNHLQMRRLQLTNFCYSAPELSLEAMRNKARLAAMDRLLLQVDPDYTAMNAEQRHMVLHNLRINQNFDWFSGNICMDATADIIPMQVEREIALAMGRLPETAPPSGPKVAYQLDLGGLDSGDLLPEFGKDVGLFTDFQGKCLGSTAPKGATAFFPALAGKDFDLKIYVANVFDLPPKPGKSARFPLFTLRYENGLMEAYSLNAGYDDKLTPQAIYRVGSTTTNTLPWINAVNFNEYHIVKRDSLMKLFVNGQFVFYFQTTGNALTGIRLQLPWKARLYDIVVTEPGRKTPEKTVQK